MQYSYSCYASLKNVKTEFLLNHLLQVPRNRLRSETKKLLHSQLLSRSLGSSNRCYKKHSHKDYSDRIYSVWISTANILKCKGEWEKALIIAHEIKSLLSDPCLESSEDKEFIKAVHSLISAIPIRHSINEYGSLYQCYSQIDSSPCSWNFSKLSDLALDDIASMPKCERLRFSEQEKEIHGLLSSQSENFFDSLLQVFSLLKKWEEMKCTPRDLFGSILSKSGETDQGEHVNDCSSTFFDVLGAVKQKIYDLLYSSESQDFKEGISVESVENMLLKLFDVFPRYAAILLRDEKLVDQLYLYLKGKETLNICNQTSTSEGKSTEFLLLYFAALLKSISRTVFFLPSDARTQEKIDLRGSVSNLNASEEDTATIITSWRSLSVLSRLLLGRHRNRGEFHSSNQVLTPRLQLTAELSMHQELPLLSLLVDALRSTPELDHKSIKLWGKKLGHAIHTTVHIMMNNWVSQEIKHYFRYSFLTAEMIISPPRKSCLTISDLFFLISEMNRLNIRCGDSIVYALFLCYNELFRNENTARNKTFSNCSSPSNQKMLNSEMISYVSNKPSDRWLNALSILKSERPYQSSYSLHLKLLLCGIKRSNTKENWIQALHVAAHFLNCVTESGKSRYLADNKGFLNSGFSEFIDVTTQELLLFFMKQQSWMKAFEILRFTSQFNSAIRNKSTSKKSKILSPGVLYSSRILRHLHFIAAVHGSWEAALEWMEFVKEQKKLRSSQHHQSSTVPFPSSKSDSNFMHYVYCLYAVGAAGKCELCEHLYQSLPSGSSHAAAVSKWSSSWNSKWFSVLRPQNAITCGIVGVALLDNGFFEEAARFGRFSRQIMTNCETPSPGDVVTAISVEFLGLLLSHNYTGTRECFYRVVRSARKTVTKENDLMLSSKFFNLSVIDQLCSPVFLNFSVILRCCLNLHQVLGLKHLDAPFRLTIDTIMAWGQMEWNEIERGRSDCIMGTPSMKMDPSPLGGGNHQRKAFVSFQHQNQQNEKLAMELSKCLRFLGNNVPPSVVEEAAKVFTSVGVGPYFLSRIWE